MRQQVTILHQEGDSEKHLKILAHSCGCFAARNRMTKDDKAIQLRAVHWTTETRGWFNQLQVLYEVQVRKK
jgi:hypothetical protein